MGCAPILCTPTMGNVVCNDGARKFPAHPTRCMEDVLILFAPIMLWKLFSKILIWLYVSIITTPIQIVISLFDEIFKTGCLPILNPVYKPMFDRIKMEVIETMLKIILVKNGMFPKTPLPDGYLSPLDHRFVLRRAYIELFTIFN